MQEEKSAARLASLVLKPSIIGSCRDIYHRKPIYDNSWWSTLAAVDEQFSTHNPSIKKIKNQPKLIYFSSTSISEFRSLSLFFSLSPTMHSSNPNDYQKYSAPPMPTVPSTGIPVSSANQFYPSNAPATFQVQSQAPVPWSSGLCDCGDDVGNCCITCWCPCITFGQIAELVDRGSTSCAASGALYTLIMCVTGCSCLYSCFYRSKMRGQYSLTEKPCTDCLVHCCCESCALCQEYRELKSRGFDMSIGWQGNLDKQSRGVTEAPVMQGGMTR